MRIVKRRGLSLSSVGLVCVCWWASPGSTAELDPERSVLGGSPQQFVVLDIADSEAATGWHWGQADLGVRSPISQTHPDLLAIDPTLPEAASVLEAIEVASYGLYVRLSGEPVSVVLRQERRDRRIVIEFPNTRLATEVTLSEAQLAAFGIAELRFESPESPEATNLPQVRLILELEAAAQWQAVETAVGDVVLQPSRAVTAPDAPSQPPEISPDPSPDQPNLSPAPSPASDLPPVPVAQVQAITFLADRSALQIQSDRPLVYTLDAEGSRYRLRLQNTQIGNLRPLALESSSRLLQATWEQVSEDVELVFEVAADIRVGAPIEAATGFRTAGDRLLSFPLERAAWTPGTPIPPVRQPAVGDRRLTVVLDPGHGGRDPGAVGIQGLREVDVVNEIVPQVQAILEQQGVRVVLTRTDNRTLDLEPRVQLAERVNAQVFVSIHANAISLSRPDVNGIETFHASAAGRILAIALQDSLIEATGSPSRGVKTARFYVIRRTSMPAALVEVGFVTGVDDAPRLQDRHYRSLLAQAIARGILQYIQQNL